MVNDLQLIIPTYGRVNAQSTFEHLPPEWQAHTAFIANKEEAAALKKKYKDTGAEFIVHPTYIDSIAKKRTWILSQERWDKLMMLDDDLRPYSRLPNSKLKQATPEEVTGAFEAVSKKLDTYVHAGFSPRQGNFFLPTGWLENKRMIYTLGYKASVVRKVCILGRVEIREDMDLTLQLLKKGYPNAVFTDVCFDQNMLFSQSKGGARASGRTTEQASQEAFLLQKLHPDVVKVVKRQYKASVPRLEVIVRWEKAFASSKKQGFF